MDKAMYLVLLVMLGLIGYVANESKLALKRVEQELADLKHLLLQRNDRG